MTNSKPQVRKMLAPPTVMAIQDLNLSHMIANRRKKMACSFSFPLDVPAIAMDYPQAKDDCYWGTILNTKK